MEGNKIIYLAERHQLSVAVISLSRAHRVLLCKVKKSISEFAAFAFPGTREFLYDNLTLQIVDID